MYNCVLQDAVSAIGKRMAVCHNGGLVLCETRSRGAQSGVNHR